MDNSKATLAMNTLINTSNRTKGKYSKLVYVANFKNPLNMSDSNLEAAWTPKRYEPFVLSYNALPKEAQDFINDRIASAQKQLKQKKYLSSTNFFDLDKLYLATMLFNANEENEQKYSMLETTIENLFSDIKLPKMRPTQIRSIKNMLVDSYLANAGSKETENNHEKLTKVILIWRIIFEVIEEVPTAFYDEVPVGIQDELEIYGDEFIKQQVEDIEIINKILAGFNSYSKTGKSSKKDVVDFMKLKWKEYVDIFPLDEDLEIQEYGIKMIILRVLNGQRIIQKIKKGVNIL